MTARAITADRGGGFPCCGPCLQFRQLL